MSTLSNRKINAHFDQKTGKNDSKHFWCNEIF